MNECLTDSDLLELSKGSLASFEQRLASIPKDFRDAMENVAIVVEQEPSPRQLAEVGIEPPDTLLGLYEGLPLTERHWAQGNVLPDKVTLFQGPIEDSSEDEDDEEWVVELAIPLELVQLRPGTHQAVRAARCDTPKDGVKRCGHWAASLTTE